MAQTNRRHRPTADRVIRVVRSGGYTVLPNGILRDKRLSLKTKGLFAVILSLPQGWNFNVAGLATVAGCGRDAVRSALKELERAGYLTRSQAQGERGRFSGVIYTIRDRAEEPLPENPTAEKPTQDKKEKAKKEKRTPCSPPQAGDGQEEKHRGRDKTVPRWKPEQFARFWARYPRHEDRVSAVRVWNRLKPTEKEIDAIFRALDWQTADPNWPAPYACRYLRRRRWTDEPPGAQERGRPAARQLIGWRLVNIGGEEVLVPDGGQ